MTIYLSQKAQILGLIQNETFIKVLSKYADYAKVFSFNLAIELPENTCINKHAIKLEEDKQLPYKPIYSLGPIELESLKTYIETYLKPGLFDLLNLLQAHPFYLTRS